MIYLDANDCYKLSIGLGGPDDSKAYSYAYLRSSGINLAEICKNLQATAYDCNSKLYEIEISDWMLDLVSKEWENFNNTPTK